MQLDEAMGILLPVMQALARAHDAAVVHRDVKPENIVLSLEDGSGKWQPKLIDFGICKTGPTGTATTGIRTGHAIGTTLYMSPEQVRAEEVDGRTDVWAIGVVLYELLAGRRPFEGNSHGEIAAQILTREPPSLRTQAPDVPGDVEDVVVKALQKDRAQRLPTMQAMIDALLTCGAIAEDAATPVARVTRAPRPTRPALATSAVAIAALVLGVLVGARWASQHREAPAAAVVVSAAPSPPAPAAAAPAAAAPAATAPAVGVPDVAAVKSVPPVRSVKHVADHSTKLAASPAPTAVEPPAPRPRPPILEP
jgi:hypothetical protein